MKLHPFFDFGGVFVAAPPVQVDDHDAGVEIAGFPVGEGEGEGGVGPEGRGEVGGEIGVAVLRRRQDFVAGEGDGGQFGNVIDED